jgi:hypothetical protein
MSELAVPQLSREEARSLTDEVREDAERLWRKLLELYEGRAHEALGYSSWGDYFETEFGGSDATAYRLLQSARVMKELPIGSPAPANEAQARELVPLLDTPEELRAAVAEVVEMHPKPTAVHFRTAVKRRAPAGRIYRLYSETEFIRYSNYSESPRKRQIAEKRKRVLYDVLGGEVVVKTMLNRFDEDSIQVIAAVTSYDELRHLAKIARANAKGFQTIARRIENIMAERHAAGLDEIVEEEDSDA